MVSTVSADAVTGTRERRSDSPARRAIARFGRDRLAVLGMAVIVILILLAAFGSDSASLQQDLTNAEHAPNLVHWFGTDALGRDVFARTLIGGRVSVLVGFVSVLVATFIGIVTGALAGYYRRLDFAIMRGVDVVMSFPTILLLLIAVSLIGPGLANMVIMIGLLTWTAPCRIVRGEFLRLRDADFVVAGRCIGLRDRSIVVRHIIPNAIAPMLVYISLGVASNVLLEAGLSYLGLGVQPPTPSWGNMLNTARSLRVLDGEPWQWVPPGIFVVLFVLAVNFVGDGIREAIDPTGSDGS